MMAVTSETMTTKKASTCLPPFLLQAYAREWSFSTRSVTRRQPEILLLPSSLLVVDSATTMMLTCYFTELNPAARTQMMIPVNQICVVMCNQPFLLRLLRSGRPSVFGMNLLVMKSLAIAIFTIKDATKKPAGLSFKLLSPGVFGTHLLASSSPRHFRRIQQQQCH